MLVLPHLTDAGTEAQRDYGLLRLHGEWRDRNSNQKVSSTLSLGSLHSRPWGAEACRALASSGFSRQSQFKLMTLWVGQWIPITSCPRPMSQNIKEKLSAYGFSPHWDHLNLVTGTQHLLCARPKWVWPFLPSWEDRWESHIYVTHQWPHFQATWNPQCRLAPYLHSCPSSLGKFVLILSPNHLLHN